MAGVSISRNALDAFVCSASNAIEIILVRKEEDLQDKSKTFHPELTHQLFGENESIFGYKDLCVKLYYSAARLTTYLGMSYSEKVNPAKFDGVQPDEVLKIIDEKLQPGYHTNIDDFVASLPKDSSFVPHGNLIHTLCTNTDIDGTLKERRFEIYAADITVPGFCEYHERLQTFLLWFVDAASFISADDDKWNFYLIFEKYVTNGNTIYAIAGYATVYHYYAYPNKIRPRISQMLILPSFQRCGLGAELLTAIYHQYWSNRDVLDITVEDPSDAFTRIRDYVDAKHCLKLPSFHPHNLNKGFSESMVQEAQSKLKINKRQTRRIYEILRLKFTDIKDCDGYRAYRLEIKKRLNVPFQKQKSDLIKLQRTLRPEEYRATMQYINVEQRMEQLDRLYKELENEYRHILERLAVAKD